MWSAKRIILPFLFLVTFAQVLWADIESIEVGGLKANCYLLSEKSSQNVLIIDPGAEPEKILNSIEERKLNCEGIIITHSHRDHFEACNYLQQKTGAQVFIHEKDYSTLKSAYPNLLLENIENDGDLRIGSFDLRIIHTPGHTPGSICIVWKNNLFSGDTLFSLSIGKSSDINLIKETIQKKLWKLNDSIKVFPGHGDTTSIGFEKQFNPFCSVSPNSCSPPISWVNNYETALQKAKEENRFLLLFLTIDSWPCACSYRDLILQDPQVSELLERTVNCKVDLSNHPNFGEKYKLNPNPSTVPVIIIEDSSGNILDIMEKLSKEVVIDGLQDIFSGDKPYQDYYLRKENKSKSYNDYFFMAKYLKKRKNAEKSIFYFEKARSLCKNEFIEKIKIEKELLDSYTNFEALDDALELADSLLESTSKHLNREYPEILFRKCSLLYKKKEFAECLLLLGEFIKLYSSQYETGPTIILKGLCQISQGNSEGALETLEKINEGVPPEIIGKSLYLQGYIHLTQQNYKEANEFFSTIAREYPNSDYAKKASDFLMKISGMEVK